MSTRSDERRIKKYRRQISATRMKNFCFISLKALEERHYIVRYCVDVRFYRAIEYLHLIFSLTLSIYVYFEFETYCPYFLHNLLCYIIHSYFLFLFFLLADLSAFGEGASKLDFIFNPKYD